MTTITISAPGIEPLTLAKRDGWVVKPFDWRPGAPREVTQDAPDAHGMIDTTSLLTAGSLTMGIRMFPKTWPLWTMGDLLARFAHPRLRPYVIMDRGDGSPARRVMTSRWIIPSPVERPTHRDAVAQCAAPFGAWESVDQVTTVIFPGAAEGSGGLELPTELPVEFVSAGPPGSGTVTNLGTFDALPVLRVVGPCKGPIVENRTVGRSLVFDPDFEIVAGDYLEIDTRAKTIRLNGLANQSRYDELDFAASAWWSLVPGVNDIRFTPVEFSSPCQLVVLSRSAWI